ncbi:MAG: hypothetical protein WC325_13580, partial [Candidatus Bathyarchaeia archaeon]
DGTNTTKTVNACWDSQQTERNPNTLLSCVYLKQLIKSLLSLAETTKISFAYDNPFVFDVKLKYGMGSITLYIAPAIHLEVKR